MSWRHKKWQGNLELTWREHVPGAAEGWLAQVCLNGGAIGCGAIQVMLALDGVLLLDGGLLI